jgi:hypothetical protein
MKFSHKFVKSVPDKLEDGVIYVSMEYASVIHKCPSGCGNEIVTPLSPTDWKLTFDGETISLYPSIGNWNLDCQSHYWITNDQIKWAPKWTREEIESGKAKDESGKKTHYKNKKKSRSLFRFFQKKSDE